MDNHEDVQRNSREQDRPSGILSTDPFDRTLDSLIGHPNGAHSGTTAVQVISDYKHVTAYVIQTVRTELGDTVFIAQTDSTGSRRFILPPKVLAVIDRQRDANTSKVRRRHGKRLAEERGLVGGGGFTPEMRAKALATRIANAKRKRKS